LEEPEVLWSCACDHRPITEIQISDNAREYRVLLRCSILESDPVFESEEHIQLALGLDCDAEGCLACGQLDAGRAFCAVNRSTQEDILQFGFLFRGGVAVDAIQVDRCREKSVSGTLDFDPLLLSLLLHGFILHGYRLGDVFVLFSVHGFKPHLGAVDNGDGRWQCSS
ncbi:hypothetical protein BC939DRAFT_523773, partial [Gamsiella multidivaricata]|uniref:uncharacterized protein n=1 Tax=Gamsiella multidivaricata TaxID=101098 RepID=UPI00221EF3F9